MICKFYFIYILYLPSTRTYTYIVIIAIAFRTFIDLFYIRELSLIRIINGLIFVYWTIIFHIFVMLVRNMIFLILSQNSIKTYTFVVGRYFYIEYKNNLINTCTDIKKKIVKYFADTKAIYIL